MRFFRAAPGWFWIAVAIILGLFIVAMSPIFFGSQKFGEAPTPEGYTLVGEDISFKCDHGIILWYDNYKRQSLPPTPNDGRCHAS
jgi:hypothetical protein